MLGERGLMDQGLAAVLGAFVGALASGGGAYVSGVYAKREQKKQARRGVYHAFLYELSEVQARIQNLQDLMFYGPPDEADAEEIRAGLEEVARGASRLRGLETGVRLEGPDSVSVPASEARQFISGMWARMKFAHSGDLDRDQFWHMKETIDHDYSALGERIEHIHTQAKRHL
ncbi:hypothetical protein [Streptomyces bluensis]|uniref:hypothetical protein n=1 Tax=Streptomyces bluensis TaxID=33897 RepID=UPI00332B63D0